MLLPILVICALLASSAAEASCGSAFCVLNTNWATQGASGDPGSFRLDMRYEFVDQKRLRMGNRTISQREDAADTTELRTINRNLLATLDYTLSKNWVLSASLPVVTRSHSHIADPTGAAALETWSFSRVADSRILGFYKFDNDDDPLVSYGFLGGFKLPTGEFRLRNGDGTLAERALQPGTGSTDIVFGGYYTAPGLDHDASWSMQALIQQPARIREDYKPGTQYQLNVGYRQPLADSLHALIQVNGLVRRRDTGLNAEPDLSGSKTVYLSPGLSYSFSSDVQVYGFVQLPIYRYVNGVQLSADRALVAGITVRF
jgi:hypothetical protein